MTRSWADDLANMHDSGSCFAYAYGACRNMFATLVDDPTRLPNMIAHFWELNASLNARVQALREALENEATQKQAIRQWLASDQQESAVMPIYVSDETPGDQAFESGGEIKP